MTESFNEIMNNKSFEKDGPYLIIGSKDFSKEEIYSHDLGGLLLTSQLLLTCLTFLDCNFINVNLSHTLFISCNFTNCRFSDVTFFKSELEYCNFKNCNIFQSNLTRTDFMNSEFTDCQFDTVVMGGSIFTECEFIQPKFYNINLDDLSSVTLDKSKIWNSNKCIEVKAFENVSNIINDLEN